MVASQDRGGGAQTVTTLVYHDSEVCTHQWNWEHTIGDTYFAGYGDATIFAPHEKIGKLKITVQVMQKARSTV